MSTKLPEHRKAINPIFTLDEVRPGLVSARLTFVALGDPTGYEWANRYLGDYNHWVRLMKSAWFQSAVTKWRAELAAKLKAQAMKKIVEMANSDDKQALPAARFLADLDKPTRGRPSKEEVSGELKRATEALEAEDEDMARIGLKVIQGGKSEVG